MSMSKSTGNDVVALKAIDKQRSNNTVFYSKIISISEHSLYCPQKFTYLPFETFLWLLWSVKESVYKYVKRTASGIRFSPTKITIRQIDLPYSRPVTKLEDLQWESGDAGSCEDFYRGTAVFESRIFYFRSKVHSEVISSVVNEDQNLENTLWGFKWINHPDYDHQSAAVRAFALDKLNFLYPDDNLRIEKSPAGYPVVLKGAKEMGIPLSLAHHDHFVAYSLLIRN
jgi:phosphopantetheinyl transferase (holo-ACP synthase)